MTKKNLKYLLAVVVVVACSLAIFSAAYYGNAVGSEIVIFVNEDSKCDDIAAQIKESLRSPIHCRAFDSYSEKLELCKRLKCGRYVFGKKESVIRIVRRLVLGEQTPVKLVIGEARTLPQLAGKLAKQLEADSLVLLRAMRNKQIRKELGFAKDSTISMFIPNTYEVYWNISPEKLLYRISREYSRFWNTERTAKLKRCKLSKYEVMTLASIVYEETKIPGEMRMIAGVYINRLRGKIALGACPTIKYAMGKFELKRILHKHLTYNSPFNTYTHRGLPPAPICIPSIEAIEAVLNYSEHKYLYFCARPEMDGRHNFARTLKEHNANAQRYSAALERLKIK